MFKYIGEIPVKCKPCEKLFSCGIFWDHKKEFIQILYIFIVRIVWNMVLFFIKVSKNFSTSSALKWFKAILLSQIEGWPKLDLSNSDFPPFYLFWIDVGQCQHWKNCFWPIRICFDLKSGGKFKKDKWFLGHPSIWLIISALGNYKLSTFFAKCLPQTWAA